jgi:hypothetical protein
MKSLLQVILLAIMFFSSNSFAKGSEEEDVVVDAIDSAKGEAFGVTEADAERTQDNSDLMIESGSDDSDDSDDEDTDSSSSTSPNSSADQDNITPID